jgi:putative DNA methylase
MTTNSERLIEVDFPLRQASLDSLHEKNVRHGHISTLHIWPARRPLAASRATLIAALIPAPTNPDDRRRLVQRIGGTVVSVVKRKRLPDGHERESLVDETIGGVLHWGRERGPEYEALKAAIRESYGGRPPRVLDPFAGGGAIPLEAMRLGCEVTAGDINPVAWFILKCTLEYPQRFASRMWPLPDLALRSRPLMERFFQDSGRLTRKQLERNLEAAQMALLPNMDAGLAWHFRAWTKWVVERARADLEGYYPSIDGVEPIGYLWARTARCRNCRATIPLLKTRWLARTPKRRTLLSIEYDEEKTPRFRVIDNVPLGGGNPAQRREHDRRIGAGTMSRSGARCPVCRAISTMDDLRHDGQARRLQMVMTAVAIDGPEGKAYRSPVEEDILAAARATSAKERVFAAIPFGAPDEPLPSKDVPGVRLPLYGFDRWSDLFTDRQLLALGTFVAHVRAVRDEMQQLNYPTEWIEAVVSYLALALDRLADRCSTLCQPDPSPTQSGIGHTFWRFALPMNWDFIEGVTINNSSGGFEACAEWIARVLDGIDIFADCPPPRVVLQSATRQPDSHFDLVVTDPPYYGAIPYASLMDYFHIWLRRVLYGLSQELDEAFADPLGPKWDPASGDGELIDDPSRFGGNRKESSAAYEQGMARSFCAADEMLVPDGHFVIVFAHKDPDAWEALVSAVIRAGFIVEGSWPIQTERGNRMRALGSAALSSSVWLVCRTRPVGARPGWDNRVLAEMEQTLPARLRQFWDSGIRGPDFVWAATGPGLTAYSRYPIVKKANSPGATMTIREFLATVRRFVVDFVVGRLITATGQDLAVDSLDGPTAYYLLHRHGFGLTDAPSGACILYAISCTLSERELIDQWDLLARSGHQSAPDEDADETTGEGSGSLFRLKAWSERKRKTLGQQGSGSAVPLIDQIHHTMQLWRAGDAAKVNAYLDQMAIRGNGMFRRVLQAVIELAPTGSEERSILESISNHLGQSGGIEGMPAPANYPQLPLTTG